VAVTFSCTDTGAGVKQGDPTGDQSFTSEGSHTAHGACHDVAGNEATKDFSVRIDKHDPTVAIAKQPASEWSNGAVTITASPDDTGGSGVKASSLGCKDGQDPLTLDAQNKATVSAEGVHAISCSVEDNAGNQGSGQETVKIDKTKPVISADTHGYTPGAWTKQDVTVDFSCQETGGVQSGIDSNTVGGGGTFSNDTPAAGTDEEERRDRLHLRHLDEQDGHGELHLRRRALGHPDRRVPLGRRQEQRHRGRWRQRVRQRVRPSRQQRN
jgi:hypothetical protein